MQYSDTIYSMLTYSVAATGICCVVILFYRLLYRRGTRISVADLLAMASIVLLSGLRYDVGSDYIRYMDSATYAIQNFSNLHVLFSLPVLNQYSFQIGYQFLSVIAGYISKSPYTIFWLVAIIIYPAIVIYGRKYTRNALYAVSAYLLFGYWGMSLNVLKQAIAIVFILYAYHSLKRKKYFWFIICAVLSVIFHSSSIIAIVGIIIVNYRVIRPTKRFFFVFIVIGIGLRFSLQFVGNILSHIWILQKYITYFLPESEDTISRSFIWVGALLETLFVCVIVYIAIDHIGELRERSDEADNIISLIIIGIPLSIMGISTTMWLANRLAKDFFIFMIVLWPLLLDKNVSSNKCFVLGRNNRVLLWVALIAWHAMYSVLMLDNSSFTIQTYLFN